MKDTDLNIYIASSWRNKYHAGVIDRLTKEEGLNPYNFKAQGETLSREQVEDIDWQNYSAKDFTKLMRKPKIQKAFITDYRGMMDAEAFVLVQPSGRSAHLEIGWAAGRKIPTCVYMPEPTEPELMLSVCDFFTDSMEELVAWLNEVRMLTNKHKFDIVMQRIDFNQEIFAPPRNL